MIFFALITLLIFGLAGGVLASNLPDWFRMAAVGVSFIWAAGVLGWTYRAYRNDPRGLAYGPNEYLEESRLAHQRHMASVRITKTGVEK